MPRNEQNEARGKRQTKAKYIISLLRCHIDRREISFSFTPPTKISRYARNDNSTWRFPNCGIKYVTEFMNQFTKTLRLIFLVHGQH